jgi:hypothetical protein
MYRLFKKDVVGVPCGAERSLLSRQALQPESQIAQRSRKQIPLQTGSRGVRALTVGGVGVRGLGS